MKTSFAVMALTLIGAQVLGTAAEAAMPAPIAPRVAAPAQAGIAGVEKVDLVCDFSGCYETWDRPRPPRYRPPPPDYYPPSVYDEPAYRPPPPPPVYRPRPRPPVYVEPGYRPPRNVWARHVEWCLNRYRSYNPRTNEFLSSGGYYKTCRSPFY
ncbi:MULTISPECIES: BA14K family protein [Rhizobium]|uniref:Lectin-like protein BA14k n=1 Tax=Rhizobium wuzhouense TaxID=1986026 RepID=A0ABX5NPG1_9HYPH|nr:MULTISPECIES: BA14K family protein [Rhizobium]PYB70099.1 BA14K family protein [Rhizobium wuzhouense]RKE78299.1 BA14K-like protein [Rhizobium sp. AG855]